jgi:hypothetical protein
MPRSGARHRDQELEGARLRAHRSLRARTRSIFVLFLNHALSGSERTLTKMAYSLMRRCVIVRKSGSVPLTCLRQPQTATPLQWWVGVWRREIMLDKNRVDKIGSLREGFARLS